MNELQLLQADWPAPESVHSLVTTRAGGSSAPPYDSLNLALHVGDQDQHVYGNRELLQATFREVSHWQWLEQEHGARVHRVQGELAALGGDALVTDQPGLACCILTADCLPVLLCNEAGSEVAAIYCGWRGLAAGIIDTTLQQLHSAPEQLMAWLGPAIGPCCFEVGAEVRDQFLKKWPSTAMSRQFEPLDTGKFLADLYGIARSRLHSLGIERVYGGNLCTFCDPGRFYSYRRDGRCGRMLSAIYLS